METEKLFTGLSEDKRRNIKNTLRSIGIDNSFSNSTKYGIRYQMKAGRSSWMKADVLQGKMLKTFPWMQQVPECKPWFETGTPTSTSSMSARLKSCSGWDTLTYSNRILSPFTAKPTRQCRNFSPRRLKSTVLPGVTSE